MSEHVNNDEPAAQLPPTISGSDDPGLYIGYLVTGVRTRMMQEMDACLNPYGLTAAQFIILRRIAEGVATTAAELCRVLEYDTGSMTRMLDRLEEKNVIIRERSSDDRRGQDSTDCAGRRAISKIERRSAVGAEPSFLAAEQR
jgi:hypothetical protein